MRKRLAAPNDKRSPEKSDEVNICWKGNDSIIEASAPTTVCLCKPQPLGGIGVNLIKSILPEVLITDSLITVSLGSSTCIPL